MDGTFPAGEKDILIGGDMNASRYDTKLEDFWDLTDATGLNLKALSPEDGEEYLGTRLAGVPLVPSSKIDYLMFSNVTGGLGNDPVQNLAQVRQDMTGDIISAQATSRHELGRRHWRFVRIGHGTQLARRRTIS